MMVVFVFVVVFVLVLKREWKKGPSLSQEKDTNEPKTKDEKYHL